MTPVQETTAPAAELLATTDHSVLLWQLSLVAVAIALAWLIARRVNTRLSHVTADVGGKTRFGLGSAQRLLFPLIALCLVAVLRLLLGQFGANAALVNVAVPLLGSLVIIRAVVYLLNTAFDEAPWLAAWDRAIAWIVWGAVALHITGVLPEVIGTLDGIRVELSGKHISVLTVIKAIAVVAAAILLGLWIGRLLERRLMKAEQIELNVRVVLSRLLRVLLMLLAVMVALPALGIDITVLSVFSGALGVGIGFGLQKIASNYVSGFTILLDRSITPGAMITIEGFYGQVTRVGARYVLVRGLDGTEAIVPNETVVTSVVINHSLSDPKVRVELRIQISYRDDPEKALDVLLKVAEGHSQVLKDPAPVAILGSFDDSGITLRLFVWIVVPESAVAIVQSDIYRCIWRDFKAQGISIPFPQREVRILPSA